MKKMAAVTAAVFALAFVASCGDKGGGGGKGSTSSNTWPGGTGGGGGTPPPPGGGGGPPPPPPPGGGGGGGGDGSDGPGVTYPGGHPVTFLTTSSTVIDSEDQVLALVNAQRASIGKAALSSITLMRQTARGHSAHMSSNFHDFFDHVNPEGDNPSQRYALAGGSGGCGENIAGGYSTPQAAFDGWMSSPGHKANIEGNYTKTGIGYYAGPSYGHYWTQMFQ